MIRIANGQGFWGDWLEAPVRLVEQGPIDYLILDYLAEVTMSILQKQKERDPKLGYASDFPPLVGRLADKLRANNIKVIANAGGVNPVACAQAVLKHAPGLKVAVVLGDDVLARIDDFLAKGYEMRDMDTERAHLRHPPADPQRQRIYRRFPAGRSSRHRRRCRHCRPFHRYRARARAHDSHLRLGSGRLDKLAAGTIAGHIVECGAQCSGGNCQVDWQNIPDLANIGYPIVEAEADGSFVITKHAGTGGRVHSDTVKEQLLYELGDPSRYITPDCIADFTSIQA